MQRGTIATLLLNVPILDWDIGCPVNRSTIHKILELTLNNNMQDIYEDAKPLCSNYIFNAFDPTAKNALQLVCRNPIQKFSHCVKKADFIGNLLSD
jgi:hypothetical protein